MDYLKIKEDIKSDFLSITSMDFGVLPARVLYGSIAEYIFKIILVLFTLSMCISSIISFIYSHKIRLESTDILIALGWFTFIGFFLGIAASNFILFSKLVKGKLKSEYFFKQKYRQILCLYMASYSIIYIIISICFYDNGRGSIEYIFPTMFGFLFSFALVMFIVPMEMNRIGMSMYLTLIEQLTAKAMGHSSSSITNVE